MKHLIKLALPAAAALLVSAATISAEAPAAETSRAPQSAESRFTTKSSNGCCWAYYNGIWYCIPCG